MATTFPDHPWGPRQGRAAVWIARGAGLARAAILLLLLTCVKSALAYSFACGGSQITSPFPAKLINSAIQDGTVIFNGALFLTVSGCKNNSTDGGSFFSVAIPTDNTGTPLSAVPGITVKSSAAPNYSISTISGAACTFASQTTSAGSTYITFNHPFASVCNYQVAFPMSLTMHTGNGPIAGTVGTELTNRTPLLGGQGWVLYSAGANDLVGKSSTLELIATTCTLSTNNVTVTLPKILTTALSGGAGATAGRTAFTLALSGCSNVGATYIAHANWTFAPGPAGPFSIANSAANPASHVFVQLLDASLMPIGNQGTTTLATISTAGSYQVQHYAQYYATGPAGAGLVKGLATLTLSYE